MRRNFSLVARYLLEFTRCSLFTANSLVARYLLEFTRCLLFTANSLVASSSLQIHSLFVTRCKFTCCSLLDANSLDTRYSLQISLATKSHSFLVMKLICWKYCCLKPTKMGEETFQYNLLPKAIKLNVIPSQREVETCS